MPHDSPIPLVVRRVFGNTADEVFTIDNPPLGLSSVHLAIEGLGASSGVITTVGGAAVVTYELAPEICNGLVGAYRFSLLATCFGKTTTIVQGEWIITAARPE